jgi:hypothetical protein
VVQVNASPQGIDSVPDSPADMRSRINEFQVFAKAEKPPEFTFDPKCCLGKKQFHTIQNQPEGPKVPEQ